MLEDRILKINIEEEMKTAYIDYSMSVIVSRALPDARDGFKPVHRRILFGMNELGNTANKPHKKSARIVGDVMGKYHPHGDSSIYYALVRMAQKWAMRNTLVDGQGNFGSVDGDGPAAMRYTECRLSKIAEEMLRDIAEDTVDFKLNFDDTRNEPVVLPTRLPNLLVNGSSGIAVGMATNMAPHNLSEVVDGLIACIQNPDIEISELMHYIKAPDFPTGAYIYGYQGVKDAFETGRGRIMMRAKTEIETTKNNREHIIITEIPYTVNKSDLIKNIADLVTVKRLEGISNVSDETNREGTRIVIDIKRDANTNVVLNKLFKMTAMQTSFSVNNVALVPEKDDPAVLRPKLLNLKDILTLFIEHRHEVVIRRTKYRLRKAEERAHILEGLIIASDNIDEVVQIIRNSKSPDEAKQRLMERFNLSIAQSTAIVEMRLRQLTGLEQAKLHAEQEELFKKITYLNQILSDNELCMSIIKDELLDLKAKYGDERRSEIVYASEEFNPEDFYADDDMVITISHLGYIKRTALAEFRSQNRGGVGSKGSNTRDEDFVEYIYSASMHDTMMFFTRKGKCYWLKVYEIPEGTKVSKGRAIQNILNIEQGDVVTSTINVKDLKDRDYLESHYLLFSTKQGLVKKSTLEAYSHVRQIGIRAINLRDDDEVVDVRLTDGNHEIVVATYQGKAIRFPESKARCMGRTSTGVRAVRLNEEGEDFVVGMIAIADPEKESILVVSEKGYGKRSMLDSYRITNRGGKGVRTINVTEKTGNLISIKNVTDANDLMIINKSGVIIRLEVSSLRLMGRATQGVRLINLEKRGDAIASVCKVDSEELEELETELPTQEEMTDVVAETVESVETVTDDTIESEEREEDIVEENSDEDGDPQLALNFDEE